MESACALVTPPAIGKRKGRDNIQKVPPAKDPRIHSKSYTKDYTKQGPRHVINRKALTSLPLDCFHEIFQYLIIDSVLSCAATCTYLKDFCADIYLPQIKSFNWKHQEYKWAGLKCWFEHARDKESLIIDCRFGSIGAVTDYLFESANFNSMRCMNKLTLRACHLLTDRTFSRISQFCNSLTSLDFSFQSELTPNSLQLIFQNNHHLTFIALEKSIHAVNDATLMTLAKNCPNLRTISLAYCILFSDVGLDALAQGCPKIAEISLVYCSELSSAGLMGLVQNCKEIAILSLERCYGVDDSVLRNLGLNCKNLQVLGIENCPHVTSSGMSALVAYTPKLYFISADNCRLLGAHALQNIAINCKFLVDLFVNKCTEITDASVELVAKNCPLLSSIGIEECEITDLSVFALAKNCPKLIVIGLNVNFVTDESVGFLVKNLPDIQRLYLSHTKVTNLTLQHITKHCFNLISLGLIGCSVDSRGLLLLGKCESACRGTLRDLHLSSESAVDRNFYVDMRENGGKKGYEDKGFIVIDDEGEVATVLDFDENEENEIDEPTSYLDFNVAMTMKSVGFLDLEEVIFGQKCDCYRHEKLVKHVKCRVYLR